jgi:indole-3-glycerol phosphate synthase
VLLIVAALDDGQMAEIEAAALERGMDVLVEVHDEAEMARAARLRSRLIGVNNRDLRTFDVGLGRTATVAALAPPGSTVVAESGITDAADLARLAEAGVRCALVGEALMRQADLARATRALLGR